MLQHSTVDLPEGMPKEIFKHLKGVWVCGQPLEISLESPQDMPGGTGKKNQPRKPTGARPKKSHSKTTKSS